MVKRIEEKLKLRDTRGAESNDFFIKLEDKEEEEGKKEPD
jgi:hypothetical protein